MSYTRTSEARTTSLTSRSLNKGPSVDNQPVPRRRTIQPVSAPSSSNTRGRADNVRRRGVRRSVPASQSLHQTGRSTSNDNVSLLRSAGGDIDIHDGQFNAVAGSHISVTINAGSGNGIGKNEEIRRKKSIRQTSPTRQRVRTSFTVCPFRISLTYYLKGGRDDRGLHEPSIPPLSSWEIYYRHIGAKGRGSPLWIPEPNKSLHIDYQRRGISIGDVGIITFDGGFDFLFNICLPKGHPVNPPNLPDIFTTVEMSSRDIRQYTIFRGESYLSSASIKKSLQQGGVSSLIFESSASEGAILAMPAGSNSAQLLNIGLFRKWVIAHAEDLYKYVNDTCGREAKNGDVRIVTGFDKTTKWGMATFSNTSSTAAESSLLLKFRPLDSEGDLGPGRS
ncbi:hypothetical protein CPB84DRAFT_961631 [Gymnopilus junonius]|uniref:Uncharacterized protein n=1 Tax=Gymnopilus junonius TaxID=109634 RepID=A0A9P5TMJ8_GYMJU|nr:hypothetical protein CPB84DRAFT_961631 [Gymnopilus junonius]